MEHGDAGTACALRGVGVGVGAGAGSAARGGSTPACLPRRHLPRSPRSPFHPSCPS